MPFRKQWSELQEDYNDSLIKKARINFRPGSAIVGVLSNLTFAKVKPRYTKEDKENTEEGGEDLTDWWNFVILSDSEGSEKR